MTENGYRASEAAADLRAAGLLAGILVAQEGRLAALAEESAAQVPATDSFRGAGLDSRTLQPGELFVALPGERYDGRGFIPEVVAKGHWALTGSRGRLADEPLQGVPADRAGGVLLSPDPVQALARLARLWRLRQRAAVVGITGSNGKTTTKDLLAALLQGTGPTLATQGNYNNQLGLPLTLLGLHQEHRYAVIEMGASAEGDIAALADLARPTVGVITNAAPAHLAQFASLEGVIRGKGELLSALPADGRAILNAESPGFAQWSERAPCPVVSFGERTGDHVWSWRPGDEEAGGRLVLDGESWPVPLPGRHNAGNLAAAVLAGRALGLSDEQLRGGLAAFRGSAHRAHFLEAGGRRILDDCYNANPVSMGAACAMLVDLPGGGRNFAVLGAMAELGPTSENLHRQTGEAVRAAGVEFLVAVGGNARPLAAGFDAAGGSAHYCATLAEAAAWLRRQTVPGDRLLIKGSRSSAMDELIPLLLESLGQEEG